MTSKGLYENILIELRKAKAPSLHLSDYLYWVNKGTQEYINERYNKFQIDQQVTDDLTALITGDIFVFNSNNTGFYRKDPTTIIAVSSGKRYNSSFVKFFTPENYWHMVGSHVTSYTKFPVKCYPAGYEYFYPSKRLNANTANGIITNAYLKPNADRVYHDFSNNSITNTRADLTYYFGDDRKYGIKEVSIDYLKKPEKIILTPVQVNLPVDNSMVIEFPEYVCNEIIKRCVKLILENSSDPRLQTNIPINQTIP